MKKLHLASGTLKILNGADTERLASITTASNCKVLCMLIRITCWLRYLTHSRHLTPRRSGNRLPLSLSHLGEMGNPATGGVDAPVIGIPVTIVGGGGGAYCVVGRAPVIVAYSLASSICCTCSFDISSCCFRTNSACCACMSACCWRICSKFALC